MLCGAGNGVGPPSLKRTVLDQIPVTGSSIIKEEAFNSIKQPITKISPNFIQENFLELDIFENKEDFSA